MAATGINRSEGIQFAVIAAIGVLAAILHFGHANDVLVFVVCGIAVAGMAHVLGVATEQAGEAAGPRVSALLNATFGNAAELIIVVLAIRQGGELIDVARYSIIGSVIGNVLLILGASLLVSGLRNGRQGFNATIAGVNATMLLLATAALALPTLFSSLGGISVSDTFDLSHGVAIVMALLYVAYLVHAFRSPDESGASHGTARWSPRLALLVLALSFGALEIAVLVAAALLAAFIAISGKATWLEGLELLAIYAIAALAFWYV